MTRTLLEVEYDDRRVRFDAVADGPAPFQRVEERWVGCHWQFVGREFVDDLDVDVDYAALTLG